MRSIFVFIFISFMAQLALPAAAEKREPFYGKWGTENQCARAPIKPGGTFLAEPFEISHGWLKHGQLWCRLTWLPIGTRENGIFTNARAQCGEDAVRDYLMRFTLSNDKELTLSWDLTTSKGPLKQCSESQKIN